MKKAALLVAFTFMALLLLAGEPASPSIVVVKGATRFGDINAFGGTVVIDGLLKGSVFMIGGTLRLSGQVDEDVLCLGTDVILGDSAVIGKDLWVISNRLDRSEKSQVGGRLMHIKNMGDLRRTASVILPFVPEEANMSVYKVITITFWFILSLVIFALFPERILRTSQSTTHPVIRVGFRGLGYYLLFLVLLLLFAFLSLFLIGIPLLLVLFISYFVALAFGRTVFFLFLGSTISKAVGIKQLTPTYYILIGFLPYALCKFIPVAGPILRLLMDFFVLGISTAFFLRKRSPA